MQRESDKGAIGYGCPRMEVDRFLKLFTGCQGKAFRSIDLGLSITRTGKTGGCGELSTIFPG